ncbi:protein transport protein-related [Musa troglodytarum]|uniref:Protein transport protein-related n=1 Tax=Musa troglodytarum TaxID=320322 RepID=A0A9E7JZX9_9LILI|nr:protein transport protein-related [Musa troglodytarum]
MFKAARWRSEKNKSKAVFKLQFHATQVPLLASEAMMVSLVPADVAKPTARSEKVAAVDGTCNWANPVYETVKLVRNPKTGKMDDKVYRFLLSAAGSSKAEVLGEVAVNLADYAEVFRASSVSLPLKASNAGAILHITIQRVKGDGDGDGSSICEYLLREADQEGDMIVKRQRRTLQSQLSKFDNEESIKAPNGVNGINIVDGSHINSQAQVKFSSSREILVHTADSNGNLQKCHSFDAISASGSDTSSGIYTPRENSIKHNNTRNHPPSFLSPLTNGDTPKKPMSSSGDWSGNSAPDGSADASTTSLGDAGLNETSHDSEDSIDKLRNDIVILTRKLELSDLELQTLRKQIIKENKRGQEISRELNSLKDERDALKKECDELKFSEKKTKLDRTLSTLSLHDAEDHISLLEEIRQELDHEKNLNVHLRLQLKMTQEANAELILAVKDLDGLLEQRNRETLCIKCSKMDIETETDKELEELKLGDGIPHLQKPECKQQLLETSSQNDTEEQYALDALLNERDDTKMTYPLENKIIDLNNEVEFYRKDREDLEMQMEQLALDYEILKQENHDITTKLEQMQLREQLRMQYECSAHLSIISDLESHVECLEKELQKQTEAFEEDIATITNAKVEQEKRAIIAEEELRKTKWNNSITVERLQEEFRSLSAHMSSTFQTNENIVKQTLKEAADLHSQKSNLEELLKKAHEDLALVQDQYRMKFKQLVGLIDFKSKEADKLLLELQDKKRELQNYKMSEEARQRNSLEEMQSLKTEMAKLKSEKSLLFEQNEEKEKDMELLRTSINGSEMCLQDKNLEIDLLKNEIAVLREEVNKSLVEMNKLSHIKDEKDTLIAMLESEAATLTPQHSDLEQALDEIELGKQNLRKSVSHLRGVLLEEEQMTTSREEIVDDYYTCTTTNDQKHFHPSWKYARKDEANCSIDYLQQSKEDEEHLYGTNGTDTELLIRHAGTGLDEANRYDQKRIKDVLSEMAALKRQNESMESELKEMQGRYSEISLKFAEVEGERQQLMMTIRTLKNSFKN